MKEARPFIYTTPLPISPLLCSAYLQPLGLQYLQSPLWNNVPGGICGVIRDSQLFPIRVKLPGARFGGGGRGGSSTLAAWSSDCRMIVLGNDTLVRCEMMLLYLWWLIP